MNVNQLKAGAVLTYIYLGLEFIVSLIYVPIMLRLLGQSEYGLYNSAASVVSYLSLLNFGFGSAYIRYYSRYKVNNDNKNIAKLNGMFLIIFSIIGLIAVLAGMILVFNTDTVFGSKFTVQELSIAKILMAIMVINIAISFPNTVFNSYITANEQFIFQKVLQLIKVVANPFLTLLILLLGYGSIGMTAITTMLNLSIEIANIIFCFKKLGIEFSFKQFDLSLFREMTVFSSFIFMNMVIDQINWNVDKFILGRFFGTISVALYGLAAQLNTYYISLSTAISSVFVPRVNKIVAASNNNHELTLLLTRVGRIQFILLSLVATGLVFFGRPFINMWAGPNYDDSYMIALILILPVTIPLIQNVGIEIQKAKNMHQFRSWLYFFIAIANVAISIPLAKKYGGIGAAIGTALSLIIGNIFIMNWYYHRKVGLDMKYFWKQIISFIPSFIPPLIIGILINLCIDLYKIKMFLLGGFIYVIVYIVSMWFLGMNQYEKDLIGKPINKLFKSLKISSCKVKLDS